MDERKLRASYIKVEICAILRLLGIAFLVFELLSSSGNLHRNLNRIFHGDSLPAITLIGFTADTLLTVMWLIKRKVFKIHLILFIILGGFFYYACLTVSGTVYSGIGAIAVFFVAAPVLWGINLILFIIAGTGIKAINKAEEIRDTIEYDADDTAH